MSRLESVEQCASTNISSQHRCWNRPPDDFGPYHEVLSLSVTHVTPIMAVDRDQRPKPSQSSCAHVAHPDAIAAAQSEIKPMQALQTDPDLLEGETLGLARSKHPHEAHDRVWPWRLSNPWRTPLNLRRRSCDLVQTGLARTRLRCAPVPIDCATKSWGGTNRSSVADPRQRASPPGRSSLVSGPDKVKFTENNISAECYSSPSSVLYVWCGPCRVLGTRNTMALDSTWKLFNAFVRSARLS